MNISVEERLSKDEVSFVMQISIEERLSKDL